MEIRVLRYFLAVAREESISGAAGNLHITQPTLSRQLMELEEELGTKLLNRGKKSCRASIPISNTIYSAAAQMMWLNGWIKDC